MIELTDTVGSRSGLILLGCWWQRFVGWRTAPALVPEEAISTVSRLQGDSKSG